MAKKIIITLMGATMLTAGSVSSEESASFTAQEVQQRFLSATVDMQEGRMHAARDTLVELRQHLATTAPDTRRDAEIALRLARVEMTLNNMDHASDLLHEVFDLFPADDVLLRAALMLGELYTSKGEHEQALRVLKALEDKIATAEWPADGTALYNQVKVHLNKRYRQRLTHAERLFTSGYYQEAAPLYHELLEAAVCGLYPEVYDSSKRHEWIPQLRYRLAQSYYLSSDFSAAIEVLTSKTTPQLPPFQEPSHKYRELERNQVYLLASAYRRQGEYSEAIKTFRLYLNGSAEARFLHHDQIQWELGVCYYHLNRYQEARGYLEPLNNKYCDEELRYRALLYLARCDIAQGLPESAQRTLTTVGGKLPAGDPLRYEVSYLMGQIAFEEGNYGEAVRYYASSLPNRARGNAAWRVQALYNLSRSYLNLSRQEGNPQEAIDNLLRKSEEALSLLLSDGRCPSTIHDDALLLRAQIELERHEVLADQSALQRLEQLLAKRNFDTAPHQVQALLMRALAADDYNSRRALYVQACELVPDHGNLAANTWQRRGLNDLAEAYAHDNETSLFAEAATAFSQAARCGGGLSLTANSQRYQAEALYQQGRYEEACQLLHRLVTDTSSLEALDDSARAYYMLGQAAYGIVENGDDNYRKMAEGAMHFVLTHYPDSSLAPEALNFLASACFKQERYEEAQRLFLQIADTYPEAPCSADACHWAAECALWLGEDSSTVRALRQRVYTLHPDSTYAAEAYLRSYSLNEYLQGDEKALQHLHKMPRLFPSSPFLVQAYYLIGLDYRRDRKTGVGEITRPRDLSAAVDAFDAAVEIFDRSIAEGTIPEEHYSSLASLRYRSQLEGALTNTCIATASSGAKKQIYLEYARDKLEEIVGDLQPSPPTSLSEEDCQDMLSEAQFALAQCHIQSKNDISAEELLNAMVERHAARGIQRGYYLARAWLELGNIASRHKDYQLAVQFYSHAEAAGKGDLLSSEQRLDIWIQQAICYRELDDLETAMTLLSRVINDPAVSSQRLRAMYLRAGIYEQQGRHELAAKQLEATAKKGGEWAQKASDKLEKEYGYR